MQTWLWITKIGKSLLGADSGNPSKLCAVNDICDSPKKVNLTLVVHKASRIKIGRTSLF